ncbi:hypothetical protein GCM10010331_27690 [Streptomyces xanthochromogenes]|uniref:HEAT repeat domain-containing protein n=1 Tax=Streptomyces xanthochromogenes TaxID=67384 RepID=UPI001672D481|nr:HEAT repeat domain-containing protein [Streptomyces xanthochromogenes]GHB38550.1 hypothetical protein GCM10010331_27690 [Streptomyces xanthochromogenes]
MFRRRVATHLALALALPLATACGGGAGADAGGGAKTVTVTVGYQSKTINTVTAGTLLRSLGYFEQELTALGKRDGTTYEVKWQDYATDAPITAQMAAGKIDIGSMGDFPVLRMPGEIGGMGARTPHELMRCAEVSFIRDCAEMAARASLARTESRWGLYHERLDHPEQDDAGWLHHLDLRKSPSGAMEFTARPVEPYVVPVPEFAPVGGPERPLGQVALIPVATAGPGAAASRPAGAAAPAPAAPGAASDPALLRLLTLAEESPDLDALRPYLADPDPAVRTAAVTALGETVPSGAGPVLAARLRDNAPQVRSAAAAALRELVEVLPAEAELGAALRAALDVPDPAVRTAALEVLRALRLGGAPVYAAALADADIEVRIHAVRGLVSVDATGDLASAAFDAAREVRVAVARGLAAVRTPEPAPLRPLLADLDPLVKAAAFAALAVTGCPPAYTGPATSALIDPAWQVRAGAAAALRAAEPAEAVPALAGALADANADVRKAAIQALLAHRAHPEARDALATATGDSDADVRAYAARATS